MDDGEDLKLDGPARGAEAPIRRLTVQGHVERLRSTPNEDTEGKGR